MKEILHFSVFLLAMALSCTTLAQANSGSETSAFHAGGGANLMNPDISANGLFLYQNSNRGTSATADEPNGASVQEAEIQLMADVDPYTRFQGTFSLEPKTSFELIDSNDASKGRHWVTNYEFGPEELFFQTIALPYVTITGGKFKAAFGRHNQLHTHAFPFIDAPLINSEFLGDEGLNDVGLSAAALIPAPWFVEVTGQILSGKAEDTYFGSAKPDSYVYLAHLRSLVDVNDDVTAELGLSFATGEHTYDQSLPTQSDHATQLLGIDFTLKDRPMVGGKYHAIIFSTEAMQRTLQNPQGKNQGLGFASWVQYQFAERWWAQVRTEYVDTKDTGAVETAYAGARSQAKQTALLAFLPSEFSGFRLQYDFLKDQMIKAEQRILLQANFTIGVHPAHLY